MVFPRNCITTVVARRISDGLKGEGLEAAGQVSDRAHLGEELLVEDASKREHRKAPEEPTGPTMSEDASAADCLLQATQEKAQQQYDKKGAGLTRS